MEICVLNPFFYPYKGGTEKVIFEVYRRMAKKDNVTIITGTLNDRKLPKEEEIEGIRVIRLNSYYLNIAGLPMPLLLLYGIREAVKKVGADIYHINNRYQYYYDTTSAIKGMNKKLVLTIHNSLPKNIDPMTDFAGLLYDVAWGREVMHSADLITGVSRNAIVSTVPRKDLKKCVTLFNGVDSDIFKPRARNDGVKELAEQTNMDGQMILSTGRLLPQKGQIYLMQAVSKLIKDGYDISLLILGKGLLEKQLNEKARKLEIKKRFKILSAENELLLAKYYDLADVFVLPSLYEPASVAILEALSSQTPSTASKVGGIPEMMRDSGLYFEPRDIDGIYNNIVRLIDDRKSAEKMAKNGRKLMLKYHNWDDIAKEYRSSFTDLLKY
jgi:glycosyltransferase involved in cell wall biosynthesis